jgi:hypothetical protein
MDYLFQPFGLINLAALNEDYRWKIELNGRAISIDINFAKTNIEKSAMDKIKYFIENINNYDKQNKSYIDRNFNDANGGTVKDYITFHIEELGNELLERLDIDVASTDIEQQCLAKLHLKRVGLYPDGKYDSPCFAIFDYTLGKDLPNQYIVVTLDEEGNIDRLGWES